VGAVGVELESSVPGNATENPMCASVTIAPVQDGDRHRDFDRLRQRTGGVLEPKEGDCRRSGYDSAAWDIADRRATALSRWA
jgi:hypothetical protein